MKKKKKINYSALESEKYDRFLFFNMFDINAIDILIYPLLQNDINFNISEKGMNIIKEILEKKDYSLTDQEDHKEIIQNIFDFSSITIPKVFDKTLCILTSLKDMERDDYKLYGSFLLTDTNDNFKFQMIGLYNELYWTYKIPKDRTLCIYKDDEEDDCGKKIIQLNTDDGNLKIEQAAIDYWFDKILEIPFKDRKDPYVLYKIKKIIKYDALINLISYTFNAYILKEKMKRKRPKKIELDNGIILYNAGRYERNNGSYSYYINKLPEDFVDIL